MVKVRTTGKYKVKIRVKVMGLGLGKKVWVRFRKKVSKG